MTDENNGKMPPRPDTEKKTGEKNTKKSVAVLLVLVLLIVGATFLIANSDGIFSEQETTTKINVVGNSGDENNSGLQNQASAEKGFPVSFGNGAVENAVSVNSCVFVLTHDALTCVSATGKIIFTYTLGLSDPSIKFSENFAAVYDKQGSSYYLFNTKGLIYKGQSEEDGKILTACVANDGKTAISSRRTGSASAFAVYDKNGSNLFAWACAKEHIIAMDVDKSGRNLVCAAIGSASGEIYTKCYVFDLDKKEQTAEYTFKSSSPIECVIESSKVHLVCTDKNIMFDYTKEEITPVTVSFASTVIKRACDENGNTAVLTRKVDSFGDNEINCYDSNNKLVYSVAVSDKVCDLKIDGLKVYVLTTSQLLQINSKGKITEKTDVESASDGLVVDSRRYYRYYLDVLYLI